MALQFVVCPSAVLANYQKSLLDLMEPPWKEVKLYHLPVGSLGLAELAGGATLKDVVSTGCRIIASWPDGSVTSCEMTAPDVYGQADFRSYVTGDAVKIPFARIAEAQSMQAVLAAEFELRFLNIPGIHLEALHVACLAQLSDYILPVTSLNPELPTGSVFAADNFLTIARAIATARLAMPASSELSS
jgi:hypothetical protein